MGCCLSTFQMIKEKDFHKLDENSSNISQLLFIEHLLGAMCIVNKLYEKNIR